MLNNLWKVLLTKCWISIFQYYCVNPDDHQSWTLECKASSNNIFFKNQPTACKGSVGYWQTSNKQTIFQSAAELSFLPSLVNYSTILILGATGRSSFNRQTSWCRIQCRVTRRRFQLWPATLSVGWPTKILHSLAATVFALGGWNLAWRSSVCVWRCVCLCSCQLVKSGVAMGVASWKQVHHFQKLHRLAQDLV